ncbi:MAG: 23S rRNA (adenine(2503)-C(2))-methyltransferase RlmN [Eggerthellales bacterium]|nr:23S rRNA (adenine(2503)-C(2))-methyltransferase RlmN [Eggerthellales bacterium]
MNTFDAYSLQEIPTLIEEMGHKKFRSKQLISWVYQKGASSLDEMSNLPKQLKEDLQRTAPFAIPEVVTRQISKDGTRKYLLKLHDGYTIETVGIPSHETDNEGHPKRLTVCFSTQVGCPMECAFCATGKEGFGRNLLPGEMVQQVLTCQRDFGMRVTNAVAMGQGEPFLNYENTLAALRIMNSPDCLGIGARHITVSTCGIIPGIRRFANEPEQFTLAVSLHSAQQDVRNDLMPVCAKTTLPQLKKELRAYNQADNRRLSFEYLLLSGITDTDEAIKALISYCQGLLVHVNFLPINEVEGSPYKPTPSRRVKEILAKMEQAHIEATLRNSRGSDIDGACGQLKTKTKL